MNRNFKARFEEKLIKAKDTLSRSRGNKNYDKGVEREDRAIKRCPSIALFYKITYVRSEEMGKMVLVADIRWKKKTPGGIDKNSGIYILCTNV